MLFRSFEGWAVGCLQQHADGRLNRGAGAAFIQQAFDALRDDLGLGFEDFEVRLTVERGGLDVCQAVLVSSSLTSNCSWMAARASIAQSAGTLTLQSGCTGPRVVCFGGFKVGSLVVGARPELL